MTESPLFVALDASTTSVRALVIDAQGHVIASGRAPLSIEQIGRDGYEQDARAWWPATVSACREAVAGVPAERHGDLVALCLAHQRETIVVTDADGEPLAPALLWMDNRSQGDVERAESLIGAVRLHALTGRPPCTSPSLFKLMYLTRHRPELRDVAAVHDLHSFLSLRLTGRAVSSFASADATGLVDIRRRQWSPVLSDLVGIDRHQLPELVEAGYLIGPLTKEAASQTGLPEHVLAYAGVGDGPASALGAGIVSRDRGYLDLGNAIGSGIVTDSYQIDQAFRTTHAAIPGRYCLETGLRGGMLTLTWLLRDLLGEKDVPLARDRFESEAARLAPGSEGLLALPYWVGVMNPYWDDGARGAFLGLHAGHKPEHLYRALLEGMALEQRLHIEGVEAAIHHTVRDLVLLGGGARSDLWCQILADTLGRPLARAELLDAASLGAAVLAAVSHGVYSSFEDATSEMVRAERVFTPGPARAVYDKLYREAYRGLYSAIAGRLGTLASVREATQDPSDTSKRSE